ncbi:MAG TPA: hypothetical protein VIM75_09680, partial [Ohtaekwangia sp.]|uniref:hypothetical protein n=1 Tax=Ohtaekwangia sp. TaxID=2066019 RepID=UPI002F93118B
LLFAQYKPEDFKAALLETKDGAMIVYNGEKNAFTVRIVAASVTPATEPNFLRINNNLFQSTIIPFQEELDFKTLTPEQQKELLTGYKNYEKEYIEEQLKSKLIDKEEFLIINKKVFKYWAFNMPSGNESVKQQLYLITICYDHMLVLNAPVVKNRSESTIKGMLVDIAHTLQLYNGKTLDLERLSKELKK